MRLFGFKARLTGQIFMKFDDPQIECEYIKSKIDSQQSIYPKVICFLVMIFPTFTLLDHLLPWHKGKCLYKLSLVIVGTALLLYQYYNLKFHKEIDRKGLLANLLIGQAILIEKYCMHDYTLLTILVKNESEEQVIMFSIHFIMDLMYWMYSHAGVKMNFISCFLGFLYMIIRGFMSKGTTINVPIILFIMLKIVSLLFIHSHEKLERQQYLTSKHLISNNECWQNLFLETRNPILILSSKGVIFCNHMFSSSFCIHDDYTKNAETNALLEKLNNEGKSLKSIVDEYVLGNKVDLYTKYKLLGVFVLDNEPNPQLSFEITIRQIVWKEDNSLYLIFKDITDTISNQKDLLSKQYRNILLSTAAHELKNPLNGIVGGLQLLSEDFNNGKKINPTIMGIVKSNGELLANVINCLTDYFQWEDKIFKLKIEEVHLNDLINQCVTLFQFQAEERNVHIHVNLAPNSPEIIFSDAERIKEVIINLLTNSVKYTYKGHITIKTLFRHPVIEIIITDTGIGIKEDIKSSLFKLFGRVGKKKEGIDGGAGAGLGLSTSHAIASHLGYGLVYDCNYSKGTRFKFTILIDELPSRKRSGSISPNRGYAKLPFPHQIGRKSVYSKNASEFAIKCKKVESDDEIDDKREKEKEGENDSKDIIKLNNITGSDFKKKSSFFDEKFDDINANHTTLHLSPMQFDFSQISNLKQPSVQSSWEVIDPINEESESSEDIDIGDAINEFTSPNEVHAQMSFRDPIFINHNPFKFTKNTFYSARNMCQCKTLIIVDDNSFNLVVLEGFLTKLGLTATKAFNGQEAYNLVEKSNKCKCGRLKGILTDCEMPVMNGFDEALLMRRNMNSGAWKKLPIIAVTAYSDEDSLEKCMNSGMNLVLSKPVSLKELTNALKEFNII